MADKRYRIGFIIDDLSFGGAQKQLAVLAGSLPTEFIPRVYCLSEQGRPFGEMIERKGTCVRYFKRLSHFDIFRLAALRRKLAADEVDLVHSFLYASNAYAFLAARILRKPVILSLRSDKPRMGPAGDSVQAFFFRRCDKITVNSIAGRNYLIKRRGIDGAKIVLVRNCFLMDDVPPRTSKPLKQTIGFAGRIPGGVKNVGLLLKSFAITADLIADVKLKILGDGKGRSKMEMLARKLGIENRVEFLGEVDNVLEIISSLSCLVLPSKSEGTPNAVIEALACGVPVVASAAGDIPLMVKDGRTGRIIQNPSPESLSKAIIEVLEDETYALNASAEGPEIIRSSFSKQAMLSSLLPVYRQMLV